LDYFVRYFFRKMDYCPVFSSKFGLDLKIVRY